MSRWLIQVSSWRALSGRSGLRKVPMRRHATGQPVLVGVQAPERLAEHLGHAVARVRARLHPVVDEALAPVKTDRVIGTGEDHALDAGAPRRLEHVVAAGDVRRQDLRPGVLHRDPAQVHDAVHAVHHAFAGRGIGEIGLHQLLARCGLAQRGDVRQAQSVPSAVRSAQHLADGARGAGDEYAFHLPSHGFRPETRTFPRGTV
jgi:hypothetical protein